MPIRQYLVNNTRDTSRVTITKSHMHFRLTPRSMTSDDLELLYVRVFSQFRMVSQIWEATIAKQMKIVPPPLLSATLLGVPPLVGLIL